MNLLTKINIQLICYPMLACVVLAGCKKQQAAAPPPPPVTVLTIHQHPVLLQTSLPGRLSAIEQAEIRPQVSGVITSRDFEQGTEVKAGQSLYHIFVKPYQAALDQAQGNLASANAQLFKANSQLQRYKKLRATHAISEQEYDNSRSAYNQALGAVQTAKGQLAAAEVNMEYSHVISPISGRIGRMIYTPGMLVTAGQTQPIAIVTRLDPIYVDVNLSADDLLRLKREVIAGTVESIGGQDAAVQIELSDGSIYPQKGKLELQEPTVAPGTGTVVVRAVIPNPDRLLLPGLFVRARVDEATDKNAMVVPQGSIMRDPKGGAFVFVVSEDNKVLVKPVVLGRMVGSEWLVLSGLKEGDKVMVEGLQKVRPGMVVNPKQFEESEETSSTTQG